MELCSEITKSRVEQGFFVRGRIVAKKHERILSNYLTIALDINTKLWISSDPKDVGSTPTFFKSPSLNAEYLFSIDPWLQIDEGQLLTLYNSHVDKRKRKD